MSSISVSSSKVLPNNYDNFRRLNFNRQSSAFSGQSLAPKSETKTVLFQLIERLQAKAVPVKVLVRGEQKLVVLNGNLPNNSQLHLAEYRDLIALADRHVEVNSGIFLSEKADSTHRKLNIARQHKIAELLDKLESQFIKQFETIHAAPSKFYFEIDAGQYLSLSDIAKGKGVIRYKSELLPIQLLNEFLYQRLSVKDSMQNGSCSNSVELNLSSSKLDPVSVKIGFFSLTALASIMLVPVQPLVVLFASLRCFKSAFTCGWLEKLAKDGDRARIRNFFLKGPCRVLMPFSHKELEEITDSIEYQCSQSKLGITYISCEKTLGACVIGLLQDRNGWTLEKELAN